MSWFGGSVDLSSALTVIEQLKNEKESLTEKVGTLELILVQHQQKIAGCRQVVERAAQEEAQARQMTESAQKLDAQQSKEMAKLQARLMEASKVLDLAKDSQLIGRALEEARDAVFPPALVIAGCDGVGKATLIQRLFEEFPCDFAEAVSDTSRPPEAGEIESGTYNFVGRDEMEASVRDGRFVEVAEVGGHLYGTSLVAVSAIRNAGKVCVMHIDLAGMEQLYSSGLDCITVWVAPPNSQALIGRLERRGIREKDELVARVEAAEEDERMARLRNDILFDFSIVNDTVENAIFALKCILGNYKQFEGRVPNLTSEWRPRRNHRALAQVQQGGGASGAGGGGVGRGAVDLERLTLAEIAKDPEKVERLKDYLDNMGMR